ncbi:hypothetical protein HGRIS_006015 [Hohenbuehelia grisea]|uniref:Peptidase C14 caspase domain-containing protein n=1 Tax=Hohenbuehelia grisea TaxID=104357 RepID=A0ABR3JYI4_9AGAR
MSSSPAMNYMPPPDVDRAMPQPFPQAAPQIIIKESRHHSSSHRRHRRHSSSRPHHHSSTTLLQAPPPLLHFSSAPVVQVQKIHHSSSHNAFRMPSPAQFAAQVNHVPPQNGIAQAAQQLQEDFQYSRCTGRKKALCIGINYRGQPNELRGCINDARHVRDFLIRRYGYKGEDIVLLSDDSHDPRKIPTKRNILDAMKWLVRSARPDDSLFFHYSGHGGQTPDLDGDEVDGYDEVIYPLDFKQKGHITDDVMHDIMVKPLPKGCRLTGLFDCCHSGTVLDLPYIYSSSGRLKGSHISSKARKSKSTPADVISFSGCKDGQTSADTFAGGVAVGAMSHAFISSLSHNPKQSYQELLRSVRQILYPKYSQRPQLGSSHHINTNLRFII